MRIKTKEEWIKKAKRGEKSLHGANLRYADLSGLNLNFANLQRADLERANLKGASLEGTDFSRAILKYANLKEAKLTCAKLKYARCYMADLRSASLNYADCSKANFQRATLKGASLFRANLQGVDFAWADLQGADFEEADCRKANFQRATLENANLLGAQIDLSQVPQTIIVPQGALIVWKKCFTKQKKSVWVKLKIPEDAKRSNATSRKCRFSYAIVLEIEGGLLEAYSMRNPQFIYRVGKTIYPGIWEDDWKIECGGGIHAFLTREEAEVYKG